MVDLPLGRSDYSRSVAREARIQTRNRYFEANPVLTTGSALLSRPALKRFLYVGEGPIRAVFSQKGDFDDALFTVSGTEWYRVDLDKTVTLIESDIFKGSSPQMAATGPIGDGTGAVPPYLFMCDGRTLFCYVENGYALGRITGSPANNDKILLGLVYYQFTTGSVDAGTPAGTLADPWLIAVGANDAQSWINFGNAVSALGNPGTDYSTSLVANPLAQQVSVEANSAFVRANSAGAIGDIPSTVLVGGGHISWGAMTLQGGGMPSVFGVPVPGDAGAISVGYIAGYVVVIPTQGQPGDQLNGRFYWIKPGETTIDPLDFATAERAPDPVFGVVVFGDQFWLPGATTTEVWYFTGNINAPVQRLQGVTFDRGTWSGTALQVKESMIIVDSDGNVFQISGGLDEISRPDIAERIRTAMLLQAYLDV
jgi:hypothetical protein